VGNLSTDTTAESLRVAFSPFGTILDIHVLIDRYSGRPRGCAFVTMASAEQVARAAAAMNGALLEGRPLKVTGAESAPAGGP
jgi:cold-inducible RNA-binding protein